MISIIRILTVFLLVLLSSAVLHAQERTTATITSATIEPEPVDSVVPELAGIVVLCATEPDSKELKRQWRIYVRKNMVNEKDLGAVIFKVINDAEAHRGNNRMKRGETPDASRDRRAKMYRLLHDTAMAVIRKIG
jgi:hypothetical protein